MAIVYKAHVEIDKYKWDSCIDNSVNNLIYAKSTYLDLMAPGWQALVLNDYQAVMPLTPGTKLGFSYLYQPPLVPQMGVFSALVLSEQQMQEFIDAAAGKFKFIEIPFNYKNTVRSNEKMKITLRSNYVLPLNTSYEAIYEAYPSSTKKNLKRVKKFSLSYLPGSYHEKIIDLYWDAYGKKMNPFVKEDFTRLSSLFKKLKTTNNLLIREVHSDGMLMAAAVLPFDGKRLYNLISYVSKEGRDKEANYFLFDNIIKEFSAQPLTLDFEGSDVDAISSFYRQFTKKNEQYPFVRINELPFPIKQFKILKDKLGRL